MFRSILGVVIGAAVWMAGFFVLAIGLAQVWPQYAVHGRQWFGQGLFTFTAPMACCNLLMWAVAEFTAGWLATLIARNRRATWVLAALIALYLASLHLVLNWPRFPWWYNLGVVIPAVPAVLLGGWMATKRR